MNKTKYKYKSYYITNINWDTNSPEKLVKLPTSFNVCFELDGQKNPILREELLEVIESEFGVPIKNINYKSMSWKRTKQ